MVQPCKHSPNLLFIHNSLQSSVFVFPYFHVKLNRGYHQANFEMYHSKSLRINDPTLTFVVEYGNTSMSPYNTRESHETKFECDPIHVSLTVIMFKVDWIRIYRENTALSLSGISGLPVLSHFSIFPPLFFYRVLSLFLSYPFVLLAHSHDLFFPKLPFSERYTLLCGLCLFCLFEQLGDQYFSWWNV